MHFLSQHSILDLTHVLDPQVPTWNGSCGFQSKTHLTYEEGCKVMSYKMHGGIGTHMDAPAHFYKEACCIHELPLERFLAPIRKLVVNHSQDPDYLITVSDLLHHEKLYGTIPPKHFVIGDTGWANFWKSAEYRGEDAEGNLHFPGFSKEAAELLVTRDIIGLGIDTLSPETGKDGFFIHNLLLGKGLYIIENLAQLNLLPETGAFLIALPLNIRDAVEAPIRAIALIPPTCCKR